MLETQVADASMVFGVDELSLEPPVTHPIVARSAPVPNQTATQGMNPHRLVEMAVERGMPLETIDKLLGLVERYEAMREAERKRMAESSYIRAIAGLKAEVVTVAKTKRVHYPTKDQTGRVTGAVDFKHAELSDIMKAIAAPAKREGLTWNYPAIEQGDDWVRVTCRLRHIDGHFEDLQLGCPVDKSGKKNEMQAIAAAITYMQRYTLKSILGIAEEGDDSADSNAAAAAHEREGSRADDAVGSADASGQLDALMRTGESWAAKGMTQLTVWWGGLTPKERDLIGGRFGDLKKTAQGVRS